MAKSQITPRRFFLFLLGFTGAIAAIFVYFLSVTLLANRSVEPLSKSEKSMRAIGKAYVQMGCYELKDYYLTLTAKEHERGKLMKALDSIWANIEANVALYEKYTVLAPKAGAKPLAEVLQVYRKNSLMRRGMLKEGRTEDALLHLNSKDHHQAFFQREELLGDIGDLLPYETKKRLKPEKQIYTTSIKAMADLGWLVLIVSIVTLIVIQLGFEVQDRKLLINRVLPLFVLLNVVVQGTLLLKPVPRFNAKYQLVKDYDRFINFMSYFNHYAKLEFQHVLDTSLLAKKQVEEEMAVYHRLMRQALRDSHKKFDKKFKKEISNLRKIRAIYFTKLRVPALIYSFRGGQQTVALRLLMPRGSLADSSLQSLDPESVLYDEGQNAKVVTEFHQGFNDILAKLDHYYPVAAQKLYQKNRLREVYWGGLGLLTLLWLWLLWRFSPQKRWVLYQARKHFLVEK